MTADFSCRLLEVDFSGIEGVETAWGARDPHLLRMAKLGEHAILSSYVLKRPVDLSWSDDDIKPYLAEIKKSEPLIYDRSKRTVHGYHYGLTKYGMVRNFPQTYPDLRTAETYIKYLEQMAPGLPAYQGQLRQFAYDHGYLGGPGDPPYGHPFCYKHWFWAVLAYKPVKSPKHRSQLLAQGFRVVNIQGKDFYEALGEDGKRCVAFPPQSTAAGVLKEVMLRLFHPEIAEPYGSYIGDAYFGRTPLRAPIHDSLLLEIPARCWDRVVELVCREMLRPIGRQPLPPEWNMGTHLTVGIEAKGGSLGGSWADLEKFSLPTFDGLMATPQNVMEAGGLPVDEDVVDEEVLDLSTVVGMDWVRSAKRSQKRTEVTV